MGALPDPPLLLITDRHQATRPLPEIAEAALRAGCRWLLFRDKERMKRRLDEAGIPARVTGEPSAFQPWFTDADVFDFRSSLASDWRLSARFIELLLERGVVKAHEKFFVSMAHDESDFEQTLAAFASAIDQLARDRR